MIFAGKDGASRSEDSIFKGFYFEEYILRTTVLQNMPLRGGRRRSSLCTLLLQRQFALRASGMSSTMDKGFGHACL